MCQRTERVGLGPVSYIQNTEITLDIIQKRFEGVRFEHVNYCGNLGDPIIAKDCLDIIIHFHKMGASQTIHTNGSLRTANWWRKLALVPDVRVFFGIDGATQETHEFYRRNTSLQKILNNARAFNDAGGSSVWQMIAFKHNEHEIEQARLLSQEYGFGAFEILHTRRFHFDSTYTYVWKGEEYVLEPPTNALVRPLDSSVLHQKYSIECKAKRDEKIYVAANGSVWPCCYIPGRMGAFSLPRNEEKLNVNNAHILEIINENFFDDVEQSFTTNPQLACIATCGINHTNARERVIHIQPLT